MENLLSIFLYAIVAIACLVAASKINQRPKSCFWFIVIVLSLLAGLRHQSVGIDTASYVELMSSLRNGLVWKISNIDEPGFLLLSYALVNISKGYTLMLTVFAFIINYFTIKRLYELRNEISFTWAIVVFMLQYYFTAFNTIRQWIAMAIVFYFSKFITKGKKGLFKFILAVLVATTFHKTALITIALIPVFYLVKRSRTKSQFIVKFCMVFVLPIMFVALLYYMRGVYGDVYGSMTDIPDISIIALAQFAFLSFVFITHSLSLSSIKTNAIDRNSDIAVKLHERNIEAFEMTVAILGALCTLMVFFFRYADRLASYFMMFEIIVYARCIKKSRLKLLVIAFILVIFTYLRIMSFAANGYGEMPYLPFWIK